MAETHQRLLIENKYTADCACWWYAQLTDWPIHSRQKKKHIFVLNFILVIACLCLTCQRLRWKKCWKLAVLLTFPYNIGATELSLKHFLWNCSWFFLLPNKMHIRVCVGASNLKNCLEKVQFYFPKMQFIACRQHTHT